MTYPRFIEIHALQDDAPASLNVDHIVGFASHLNGHSAIKTSDNGGWFAKESYDELNEAIKDCGCMIRKPDPRLDMTTPLTMDDLKNMLHEPVWDSNSQQWGFVVLDPTWRGKVRHGYYLRHADITLTRFDEEDLKKFPLYGMRGNNERLRND